MFSRRNGSEGGFEGFECHFNGRGGNGQGMGGGAGFEYDFLAGEERDIESETGGQGKRGGEISTQFFESKAEAGMAEQEAIVGFITGTEFLLSIGGDAAGGFDMGADADTVCQGLLRRHDEFWGFENGDVPVGIGVHTFAIEAEVVCEGVDEGALVGGHGFEAQTLFGGVGGEGSEFAFLRLRPFDVVLEHAQGFGGVGDVVVFVGVRVNVESHCQLTIALEPGTFVITFQCFLVITLAGL